MRPLRALLPIALLGIACGDSVNLISSTVIKVESPTPNGTIFSLDPLVFRVKATNQTGVASLELLAGTVSLKTCTSDTGPSLTCEATAALSDIAAQIKDGKLHLAVTATDRKNPKIKKSTALDVFVKPLRITFTAPAAEGEPPVAVVKGTSTLSVAVQFDKVIVEDVVIASDGMQIQHFNGGDPYESQMNWPVKVRPGDHTLTATASDVQGRTDTASLAVRVLCEQDAECDLHQRCCSSGVCEAEAVTPACQ